MPLAYPEWLGGSDVLRHSSTGCCVGGQDRLPPCPHKCCSDRVIIYTCTCVPELELDRLVGIATSCLDLYCGDILLLLSRKGVCFSGGQGMHCGKEDQDFPYRDGCCERSGLRKSVGEFISMRKVARELALDTRCVMDELEGG